MKTLVLLLASAVISSQSFAQSNDDGVITCPKNVFQKVSFTGTEAPRNNVTQLRWRPGTNAYLSDPVMKLDKSHSRQYKITCTYFDFKGSSQRKRGIITGNTVEGQANEVSLNVPKARFKCGKRRNSQSTAILCASHQSPLAGNIEQKKSYPCTW